MESANRLLCLWPGFLLWARRRNQWCPAKQWNNCYPPLPSSSKDDFLWFFNTNSIITEWILKRLSCPAASEAGMSSLRKQEPCLDMSLLSLGTESVLPESRWAARHALTSESCNWESCCWFGAVSMHSLQPQLHLQVLLPLSPQLCPSPCSWVCRGTELALAPGSVSLQPSAGSSVFPLVSVSYSKGSRRSSWHQQAGVGAVYVKWGCQPKSSLQRCSEQSLERAAHSGAASETGTRVLHWDNGKLTSLGWALNPGTAAPLPARDLVYIFMSCPMVIKLNALAIQHRIVMSQRKSTGRRIYCGVVKKGWASWALCSTMPAAGEEPGMVNEPLPHCLPGLVTAILQWHGWVRAAKTGELFAERVMPEAISP